MLNFTIYTADCVGNSGNCLYPNKMIVTDKESFIKATKMDHVTAKYKGNYRSKDNFEFSDCIPLDCDNDHSDDPNEWVTPLDLKANDKVRDTFYSEILDIIAAYESGLADAIKHEYERVEHILSIKETETLFRSFENMALWKPLIQRGRVKMASRDMALRDAFHFQLSEYIQPLDRDEYQKFLGAVGDELDRLMQENQDVLRRLKERD